MQYYEIKHHLKSPGGFFIFHLTLHPTTRRSTLCGASMDTLGTCVSGGSNGTEHSWSSSWRQVNHHFFWAC